MIKPHNHLLLIVGLDFDVSENFHLPFDRSDHMVLLWGGHFFKEEFV